MKLHCVKIYLNYESAFCDLIEERITIPATDRRAAKKTYKMIVDYLVNERLPKMFPSFAKEVFLERYQLQPPYFYFSETASRKWIELEVTCETCEGNFTSGDNDKVRKFVDNWEVFSIEDEHERNNEKQ